MTDDELREIEAQHCVFGNLIQMCRKCNERWPCPVVALAQEIRRIRGSHEGWTLTLEELVTWEAEAKEVVEPLRNSVWAGKPPDALTQAGRVERLIADLRQARDTRSGHPGEERA